MEAAGGDGDDVGNDGEGKETLRAITEEGEAIDEL